jgi:predicted TIM-barrel fold metal-dependent hydrolase
MAEAWIDVHGHWIPPAHLAAMEAQAATGDAVAAFITSAARNRWSSLIDLERNLDEADGASLVLSLVPPGGSHADAETAGVLAATCNDELIAAARAHDGIHSVLMTLPLPHPDQATAEIARAAAAEQVSGIMVYAHSADWTLDAPDLEPVWEAAAAHQLPVFVHPAFDDVRPAFGAWGLADSLAPVFSSSLGAARMLLSGLFERIETLTLVIPHLGGVLPYVLQRIADQSGTGAGTLRIAELLRTRVYLDTCSYHSPAFECARQTVGVERLLAGSDFPFRGARRRAYDDIRTALPQREQRPVLYGTASELLRRKVAAA